MRAIEFLTEWKEAYLYHATTIPALLKMWQQDKMGFSGNVSTTRNYDYALGYLLNMSYGQHGGAIIWLNQDLLRQNIGRRRLPATDWFKGETPYDSRDDFQRRSDFHDTDRFETLIKNGLSPLRKYVAKIEVWVPKNEQILNNNWLKDPIDRKTWEALQRDPRVEIKQEVGGQSMRFNKPVAYHKQYNQDHDMYDPDKADL